MGNIEGESRSSVYITVYMVFNYQRTHIIFLFISMVQIVQSIVSFYSLCLHFGMD